MITSFRALPRTARLFLLYTFVSTMYFAWPVLFAYISQRFGIPAVGLYFTVISLSSMAFEVPTGYIADRFGKKTSVICGILLKITAIIILVTGTSTVSLVMNALLYGLGLALISGAIDALLYQSVTHKEYERTTALSVPFYQSGLVLSAFLGGFMFEINQHLPVIAEAALLVILIIPVLLMAKDTHKAKGELTFHEAFQSLRQILTVKASLIFLAVYIVYYSIVVLFVDILLEKKMIELTFAPSQRGMVIAGVKIAVIFLLQSVIMSKLRSVRAKAVFAFATAIISLSILGFTRSGLFFIVIYAFTNPLTMMLDAAMNPIMQKISRHETRATDISMYSLLAKLCYASVASLAGFYLNGNNTTGIFIVCAGALIAITPLLLRSLKWYERS